MDSTIKVFMTDFSKTVLEKTNFDMTDANIANMCVLDETHVITVDESK